MVEFAHGDGVGMTEEVEALPFGWPEVSPMAAAWYGMGPFWPAAGRPNRSRARYAGGTQSELGQQGSQKHRFCATFPNIGRCRHGPGCSFAHSREEVTAPLLSAEEEAYAPGALTQEFFTQRFKTLWCPIGAQHDWQACMYAHTYQDVRRPPAIGYGHQLCPFWNKKDTSLPYSQRCPLGPRCPHAHGAKEQLYHPHYFRTLVCRDLQRRRCPRADLCAFYHRQGDCRKVGSDWVDYSAPLPKEALPAEWVAYFLNPPRFQEASCDDSLPPMSPAAVMAQALACSGSEWVPGCVPEEWEGETTAEESSEVLAEESEESTDGGLPGGFSSEADCGAALAALSGGGDGSWAASPEAAAAAAAHAEAAAAMQAAVEEAAAWGAMPYLPYSGVYQGFPGCYMDPSAGYAGPPRSGKPGPRLEPIEW